MLSVWASLKFCCLVKGQLLIPLPDEKILDLSKLNIFAEDIFSVAEIVQFFFDGVENIVGN